MLRLVAGSTLFGKSSKIVLTSCADCAVLTSFLHTGRGFHHHARSSMLRDTPRTHSSSPRAFSLRCFSSSVRPFERVSKNVVVTLELTLENLAGEVLDTTKGFEPAVFIQGYGTLVPVVERALNGKYPGDSLTVLVPPEDGFGEYNPELLIRMGIHQFRDLFGNQGGDPQVGQHYQVQTEHGLRNMVVAGVEGAQTPEGPETVLMDGNHPYAGETVRYKAKVLATRQATADELEQRSVLYSTEPDDGSLSTV